MSLPTASALNRVFACPASAVLPQVKSVNQAADKGSAIHGFLADPAHDLSAVSEQYRPACEAIDLASLPAGVEWAHEVTVAWDCASYTGRELGRGLSRDYSAAIHTEYVGTADVLGLTPDAVIVLDYKTGFGRVPPPRENWQLKMLALAACRAYRRSSAQVGLILLRDGEAPQWQMADLDALDLDLAASELIDLATRLRPDALAEGEHCRNCPALTSCPPKLTLLRTTAANPATMDPKQITPEIAAAAYRRLRAVQQVCGKVEEALNAYARETPIDLGEGVVYGQVTSERERLDPLVTQAVLAKLYGQDVAQAALELDTSKAAVERALRKVPTSRGDGGLAGLKKRALDEIRVAGGIETKRLTTVKEHK